MLDEGIDVLLGVDLFLAIVDPYVAFFPDPLLFYLLPHPLSLLGFVNLPFLGEFLLVIRHILSDIAYLSHQR